MSTQIQLKRATSQAFTILNPVLAAGEPGLEIDTNKIKYGDGATAWNDLTYSRSQIDSVAGKTGTIILEPTDITNFDSSVKSLVIPSYSNWTSASIGISVRSVCVGKDNTIVGIEHNTGKGIISYDGLNWITTTLPLSGVLHIAYGNNIFVALQDGFNSSIGGIISQDGITWTTISLPIDHISNIIYNNNMFLAMNYIGQVIRSYNGTDWSIISTLPPNWQNKPKRIAYGRNKFVVLVGMGGGHPESNYGAISNDGINWTPITLPITRMWGGITYGNGKFVAVSDQSNGGYQASIVSTDGINWVSSILSDESFAVDIIYANGLFLMTNAQHVFISYDGLNWIQNTTNQYITYSLCYSNGIVNLFSLDMVFSSEEFLSSSRDIITDKDYRLYDERKPLLSTSFFDHKNSGSSKTLSSKAATQICSLTSNCTFTMPPVNTPSNFVLSLKQTGSFTASFTGVKWPGNVAPTITTGANKIDVLRFVSDGINWYGQIAQNYT